MQKVISINLNGNAYQLDDTAYEALRAYLDRAEAVLTDNPDQAEIVADLEQAIAEKCNKVLGPHKTVVTAAEIEQVLKEMGPVESGTDKAGEVRGDQGAGTNDQAKSDTGAPKRLYQIREGAMISGVCNGLAAYLGIDVTIVRIIFVVLSVITKGAWIGVYFLAMFIIPYAHTSEQRAAAHGLPFNAQEVIDQAKKNLAGFKVQSHDWKRHWRRQQRHWRQHVRRHKRREEQWWDGDREHGAYASQVLAGVMTPILGLYGAGLFVLLMFALVSLAKTGAVFGWMLPMGVPVWVGIVGLVVLFHVLGSPVRLSRHGPFAVWNGFLGFGFTLFAFWLAYTYVPEVRDFVRNLPDFLRNLSGPPR
jgi:phage shock protein PspC (stress-responsive transcriptional regulator)